MNEFLKSSWWLIVNAGYLLLILIISFIAFTVPEQTDDFIYVFIQDYEVAYMLAVYISLPIWCFITWYSACIILQIDPVKGSLDRKDNERHIEMSLLIPKILGIVPCVIFGYAITSVNLDHVAEYNNHITLHICIIAAITFAMWILFVSIDRFSQVRSNISSQSADRNLTSPYNNYPKGFFQFIKHLYILKPLGNWPSLREVDIFKNDTNQDPSLKQELIFIYQFTGIRFFYKWLGNFCLILTLAMCFPSVNLALSSWLRPGAILILSLACYTLLFTIIAYFHDYTRRPFGIVVLILVLIFSYTNDNTKIDYLKNRKAEKRQAVDVIFDRWLLNKKRDWEKIHPGTDMPIVFIATQGGGIRGMTWTTRVFHYLDSTYNGFINQTFLISGVSGGGVGATAYLSWLHDQKKASTASTYDQLNGFTKRDFLSPVTASFAFGDNFQRFIPIPIQALNRSNMLGRTWDQYYSECLGVNSFSRSFLEMWYPGTGFDYTIPSLMLNGTLAENGQRVVTSNLKIASSRWFEDDIDFFYTTEKDITRSTAALNCSRFPFITSGGLMIDSEDERKGHIVDGGYRENTGLQTLLNVFCSVRKRLITEQGIKVVVLYLQNGKDELNKKAKASTVLQDILVPIQGLVQVNGTGLPAKSIVQFTSQIFDESIYANVKFITLGLNARDNQEIELPLGWYMSDIVSHEIDQRIKDIPTIDAEAMQFLTQSFPE